jgi:hypothetical protein
MENNWHNQSTYRREYKRGISSNERISDHEIKIGKRISGVTSIGLILCLVLFYKFSIELSILSLFITIALYGLLSFYYSVFHWPTGSSYCIGKSGRYISAFVITLGIAGTVLILLAFF